jgi:hypothetical protein
VLSATTQHVVQQLEGPLVDGVPEADLSGPYTAAKLDQAASDLRPLLARARATSPDIPSFTLFAPDGTIVFSDPPDEAGQAISPETDWRLDRALNGIGWPGRDELEAVVEYVNLEQPYARGVPLFRPLIANGQVLGAYEVFEDATPLHVAATANRIAASAAFASLFVLAMRTRSGGISFSAEGFGKDRTLGDSSLAGLGLSASESEE